MDHVFGSKWLINELSRLGFSVSYDEVIRYKQSVIQSESLENTLTEYLPGTFTQWVADNVDHNVATLDGEGTFHGMGIIAVSTPEDKTPLTLKARVITRQKRMRVNGLIKDKGVPIFPYISPPNKGLASVFYKPIAQLQYPYILPSMLCSNLLWHSGWVFSHAKPRPNRSGFMQHIFCDSQNSVSKSEILYLPIIDLNPSDETCIFSTLLYIQRQARELNIPTPCITFDQPLWIKAVEIVKAKSLNVVCRLGGFHVMMSFLGSIGSMMKGSGLEEALENVYGSNAVIHMISGKAISRALRGHFLVEATLVNKLMLRIWPNIPNLDLTTSSHHETPAEGENVTEQGLSVSVDNQNVASCIGVPTSCLLETGCTDINDEELETGNDIDKLDVTEVDKICSLYEGIKDKLLSVSSIAESQELMKLESGLLKYKALLSKESPTAKLWLQYIEYVETLKLFIRAERTGDWNLHLIAVGNMINLFAATGHINYAKSSRLYLQLMLQLPNDHPWLYQCFINHGFHVVRRSSRYWAGLWTDLAIEQVMMRSIKSRGGLTKGRGMTEAVRLQWIYSMHKCAEIHNAMTAITDLQHTTSEQHFELGNSRSSCDFEDMQGNVNLHMNMHDGNKCYKLNMTHNSSTFVNVSW